MESDKRFKHVHTDPRFRREAKSERKFKPDARFQKMFTDKKFNESYKVDAWGRKIDTGKSNELLKYYDMDEETKKQVLGKNNKDKSKKKASPAAAAAADNDDDEQEEEDEESVPAPAASKKSKAAAKSSSSSKSSKAAPKSKSKSNIERYIADSDDEDDVDEDGYAGSYFSGRGIAPPSSGEDSDAEEIGMDDDDEDEAVAKDGEDDEEEEGEDDEDEEAAVEDEDEDEEKSDSEEKEDENSVASTSSDSDDADDDVEMEVATEEEVIPTGETPYRRLAVMNLEWDRLSSVDLLVLFRSFVPQAPGSLSHPVKSVKVYPSQFGLQRMKDEAMYGPTNIYAGSMTPEEYKKKLEAKMSKVKVALEEEEEEEKSEEEEDSERSSSEEDDEEDNSSKKKRRVSFPTGTKNSTHKKAKAPKKNMNEEEEADLEATDDILSRPAAGKGGDEDEDDDDEDDSSSRSSDNGEENEFDKEKLRKYELERLKYYYAVVECESAEVAQQLYNGCDGMEFEHSSNLIDLRYIPDEVEFTEEENRTIRDQCKKVPANYKPPEFYTQALQHTNVQLTWDRDDPTRVKLLQRKFKPGDEALEDLKAYLGSDNEEDGYGSDAVTEASDSGSDDEEADENDGAGEGGGEEGSDDEGKPQKKKTVLKRKARSKYLALLQDIKSDRLPGDDGGDNGEDNHEVSITFEPGLKAKGEEIAAKALKRAALGDEKEESTWEKHLRERLEKKKEKKKARKEKLKAMNEKDENGKPSSNGDQAIDSDDEQIGGKSDLYDDDEVDYDADDPFFHLSDEDELEAPTTKKSKKSAQDDDDDSGVEMSSESGEDMDDDEDDDDDDDDIDALHGQAKAKKFFDDSERAFTKKPAAASKKDDGANKKKRKHNDDEDDEDDDGDADGIDARRESAHDRASREKAELELLMMDEDDTNENGKRGYSLKTLLKAKKAQTIAESGGKLKRHKRQKVTDAIALGAADDFKIDTEDSRFGALFNNDAFSIDPTNPNFKSTEATEQLLKEKSKRRMEQEKDRAKEIARRKEEAKNKKAGTHDVAAAAAANNSSSADAGAAASSGPSLASMVASIKRKTDLVKKKQTTTGVPVVGKSAPASKRSKPDTSDL